MVNKRKFSGLLLLYLCCLLCVVSCTKDSSKENKTIVVYCGAGLKKMALEVGELFEKNTGISIQYNFGGSNILLSQLQLVKNGDIYIPGSSYYLEIANSKNLIQDSQTIAYHIPVIAVSKSNPKQITRLEDLAREHMRIAFADPSAAAIGKTAVEILKKNNLSEAIEKQVVVRTATVNELVVYLSLEQVDAAIIWEDNAESAKDKIDSIHIPDSQNVIKTIPAGILTFSENKKASQMFLKFLHTPQVRLILEKCAFRPYRSTSNLSGKK